MGKPLEKIIYITVLYNIHTRKIVDEPSNETMQLMMYAGHRGGQGGYSYRLEYKTNDNIKKKLEEELSKLYIYNNELILFKLIPKTAEVTTDGQKETIDILNKILTEGLKVDAEKLGANRGMEQLIGSSDTNDEPEGFDKGKQFLSSTFNGAEFYNEYIKKSTMLLIKLPLEKVTEVELMFQSKSQLWVIKDIPADYIFQIDNYESSSRKITEKEISKITGPEETSKERKDFVVEKNDDNQLQFTVMEVVRFVKSSYFLETYDFSIMEKKPKSQQGGKHIPSKLILRGQTKTRKIYMDSRAQKYIRVDGEHVYLKNIRGKYKYI